MFIIIKIRFSHPPTLLTGPPRTARPPPHSPLYEQAGALSTASARSSCCSCRACCSLIFAILHRALRLKNVGTMTDSDESTEKILLKGSMRWIREERNKYHEMYERTRRDVKEEKRRRKEVQSHIYNCCLFNNRLSQCLCVTSEF